MSGFMMIYLNEDSSYGFTFFGKPVSSFNFEDEDASDLAAFIFTLKYPSRQLIGVLEMDYTEYKKFNGKRLIDFDVDACVLKFKE